MDAYGVQYAHPLGMGGECNTTTRHDSTYLIHHVARDVNNHSALT